MKTSRNFIYLLVVALVCMAAVMPVYAITEQVTIKVGETKRLQLPNYITSKSIKGSAWTSTHPFDVAVMSQTPYSATVKANKTVTGKCLVHCEYSYYERVGTYTYVRSGYYDFEVKVEAIKPAKVTLPAAEIHLNVGESRILTPTLTPLNAETTFTWYSNDASTVGVFPNGRIEARKEGTAMITVKTANGLSATCFVSCKSTIPDLIITDKKDLTNIPAKANVKYERTLYRGWNSMCVPFVFNQTILDQAVEGGRIAVYKDFEIIGDQEFLAIEFVKQVDAGVPCLVYVPADVVCNFTLKEVPLVNKPDNGTPLKGSFVKMEIGQGCYKLTSDGTSFGQTKTEGASSIPFRAFIKLENVSKMGTRCLSIKMTDQEK